MLDLLFKKKISEEKLADYFVNAIIQLVDEGFEDVAELIRLDESFERRPIINNEDKGKFLLIVIAGNLKFIPMHFNDFQDVRLIDKIYKKFSRVLNVDPARLKKMIAEYQSEFSRINHPSKNTLYAMSKAVFYKYKLNGYQQEYFRNMKSPNPQLLKRIDSYMENFLWDWEQVRDRFRIVE